MYRRRVVVIAAIMGVLFSVSGCSDLTGRNPTDELPAGVPDPKTLDNPAGALALYNYALCVLQSCTGATSGAFKLLTLVSGVFSDELQSNRLGVTLAVNETPSLSEFPLDSRQVGEDDYSLNDGNNGLYGKLHLVRREARLAAAALRKHRMSPALRGHMFAVEGYAEIFLADLYCSGVPLSTVDYEQDYTYQPGSTTQAVYEHVITLFDSALALAGDSTRILNLARVGKARALLNLGHYSDAAQMANSVPDGFVYQFKVEWNIGVVGGFARARVTVADREGGVGFPYRSSADPRTAVVQYGMNTARGDTLWFPAKYGTQTSISAITVADVIEARLIEAEVALHQSNLVRWLDLLNALRTNGTFVVRVNATDPMRMDTVWNAGTGGVAGLAPLRDPGIGMSELAQTDARIDLMFAERAKWMFLTGHRQSDLRRLVRSVSSGGYGRDLENVYATGPYAGGSLYTTYGLDVDLVIPATEYRNPKFTGCLERGA